MKIIQWKDDDGYQRRRMIRDSDPDEYAINGQPLEPPDLNRLDWDKLKKNLYHELFNLGLTSWEDVQSSQTGVSSAILATFKKEVIKLYREV